LFIKKDIKKIFKKATLIILLITFSLLLSYSIQIGAEDSNKILISVPVGPSSLPAFYLEKSSDMNIETIIHKNKNIAVSRLINGNTDLALLPTNEAAKLYNKGVEIKITNIHTWGLFYVLTTKPGLDSWEDLKGQEVYEPEKGGPMDIIFSYIAGKKNIDLKKDLSVVRAKPGEISKLIINNMAETAVLREPFVSQVFLKNEDVKILINLQDDWKTEMKIRLPQASLVVTDQFSAKNKDLVISFNEEYKKAVEWVVEHQSETAQLGFEYMNTPTEVTMLSYPRLNLVFSKAVSVKEEIDSYLNLLKRYNPKTFGGIIPDEKFYFHY